MRKCTVPATMLLMLCTAAFADQYRSEVQTPGGTQAQGGGGTTPEQQLKSLDNNPYGKAIVLQQMAGEAIAKKDYKKAIGELEQALSLNSLSEEASGQMRYALAQLQMADGQNQKAIAGLESYIQSTEKAGGKAGADAYIALGSAYAGLKRYAQALPNIQKALSMSSSPPADWLQLLLAVQCGSGQGGDCAKAIEQRVRQNPADKIGWLQLTGMYMRANNMPRALASMDFAYRQGLLNSQGELLQLAKLNIAAGSPYAAGTLLDRWLHDGTIDKSAANWELSAAAWQRAGEGDQALNALNQATQLGGRGDLYLQVGQLQMDRENWAAAASAFTQALQKGGLRISAGQAYMALGYAYERAGQKDKAAQAFAAAAKSGDTKPQAEKWLNYLDPNSVQRANALQIASAAPSGQRDNGGVSTQPSIEALGGGTAFTPSMTINPSSGAVTPGGSMQKSAASVGTGDYTPIGAERAGNRDGSIPAWDGGITPNQWPAGFHNGQRLVDPYPNERPLYVITAANMAQYKDKLTVAHQTLLKKYADYKMPVYTTHRSVSFPPAIYDATQANMGRARLEGSDTLLDAKLGFPFPKPDSGVQIMWNHRVRYRGDSVQAQSTQVVVAPSGTQNSRFKLIEKVLFRYGNIKNPSDIAADKILLYYLALYSSGNGPGFTVLTHETADSVKNPRNIWVIPPVIHKMIRIPPVGYDQPFPGSDGMYFIDMIDMYNGAFDRYVWKLVGKREFIVPYNAFRISDGSYKYSQLLTPQHFNQDATRYELHRVWVIEAEERGGKHHSFGKRTFYVDEDSWTVVMVDNFDHDGNPWRFQEGHLVPRYDSQTPFCYPVITYDLKDGRYFVGGLAAEEPAAQFDLQLKPGDFLPAAISARYAR